MFRQDIAQIKTFSLGGDSWADSGCAISSIFHIVEQLTKLFYTPDMVKIIANDLKDRGVLADDLTVLSWDGCFKYFGISTNTRFEDSDYICEHDEQEVLKLQKPGYTHFVPGDGKGNYSWDSLGVRDSQKFYHIAEKRIVRILGVS